jgi:hypothetical protein
VNKGEVLIKLPLCCLLSRVTILSVHPQWKELSAHQALALYLALERDKVESRYHCFILELPTADEFDIMPITWRQQELETLPRPIQKSIRAQRKIYDADYDAVRKIEPDVDCNAFMWAWFCVNTRCVYMDLAQSYEKDNMVLAPYLDFLNHCTDSTQSVRVDSSNGRSLVVSAQLDYCAGEEIHLSYGPHDNGFLLTEYGFTMRDNPWDYIDVTEELTSMCSPDQQRLLKDVGYWGEYTVNSQEPSFRTEVALACVQEHGLGLSLIRDLTTGLVNSTRWETRSRAILLDLLAEATKRPCRDLSFNVGRIYDGYDRIKKKYTMRMKGIM